MKHSRNKRNEQSQPVLDVSDAEKQLAPKTDTSRHVPWRLQKYSQYTAECTGKKTCKLRLTWRVVYIPVYTKKETSRIDRTVTLQLNKNKNKRITIMVQSPRTINATHPSGRLEIFIGHPRSIV